MEGTAFLKGAEVPWAGPAEALQGFEQCRKPLSMPSVPVRKGNAGLQLLRGGPGHVRWAQQR